MPPAVTAPRAHLGDGVRGLIRTMKEITQIAGAVGTKLRDRSRSVKFGLLEIGRVARAKGSIDQDKLKRRYGALLDATSRWWDRRSASPRRSPKASSGQRAS
jgi:hypothetical protein